MDEYLIDLGPYTKRSPSSRVRLDVEPEARDGGGPAFYRVVKGDRTLWEGRRPYSLWEAEVLNDGTIAGYAYRGKDRSEEVLALIIAPDGSERLKEATPRKPSRFDHCPPNPRAEGMWVDPEHDLLVIRIADADVNRHRETWWRYRLSPGVKLRSLQPTASLCGVGRVSRSVWGAAPISGTPLTLVCLLRFEQTSGLPRRGVQFLLVDLDGKSVWSEELPDDYAVTGNREADREAMDDLRTNTPILETSNRGQFTVRVAALSQRVTFAISREGLNWSVREAGREPYLRREKVPPAAPSTGKRSLRLVLKCELPVAVMERQSLPALLFSRFGNGQPWREIDAIAVGPDNDFYALIAKRKRVYVFTGKGAFSRSIDLDDADLQKGSLQCTLGVLADGTMCIGSESFTTARLARIRSSGERLPPVLHTDVIGSVWYPAADGKSAWIAGFRCLLLVSLTGGQSRKLERRPNDSWIGHIDDAAIAPDGDLAILEENQPFHHGISALISLFSATGDPLACLRTPAALRGVAALARDDNHLYLTSDSGLLVYDLANGSWTHTDLPPRADGEWTTWRPLLSRNGGELFLFDGGHTVLRYDLT